MPKVLEVNGFKFFFYSSDGDGKIWLEPKTKTEYLEDFKSQEKREIKKIVEASREFIIEKWNEYFGKKIVVDLIQ